MDKYHYYCVVEEISLVIMNLLILEYHIHEIGMCMLV